MIGLAFSVASFLFLSWFVLIITGLCFLFVKSFWKEIIMLSVLVTLLVIKTWS